MTISEAVAKAINSELPNAVASELKTYIKSTEILRQDYEKAFNDAVHYKQENAKYSEEVFALRALKIRKDELDEKERGMKVEILQIRLEEANKRAEHVFALVDRIFRNPVVTRSLTSQVPCYVPPNIGTSGGYVTTHHNTEVQTESLE